MPNKCGVKNRAPSGTVRVGASSECLAQLPNFFFGDDFAGNREEPALLQPLAEVGMAKEKGEWDRKHPAKKNRKQPPKVRRGEEPGYGAGTNSKRRGGAEYLGDSTPTGAGVGATLLGMPLHLFAQQVTENKPGVKDEKHRCNQDGSENLGDCAADDFGGTTKFRRTLSMECQPQSEEFWEHEQKHREPEEKQGNFATKRIDQLQVNGRALQVLRKSEEENNHQQR